jgi:hypothetical protein
MSMIQTAHWPANFTLAEFTRSNKAAELRIDNTPAPEVIPRLLATAHTLQRIRDRLGKPIIITSGYRCQALNRAVGGVTSSDHQSGQAADIVAPGFGTPHELAAWIAPRVAEFGVGQLILERIKGKQWVHVSTRIPFDPVDRIITITDAGTRPGIHRLA